MRYVIFPDYAECRADTAQRFAISYDTSFFPVMPTVLPTRVKLMAALTYGQFNFPIVGPTCGSRMHIMTCVNCRFWEWDVELCALGGATFRSMEGGATEGTMTLIKRSRSRSEYRERRMIEQLKSLRHVLDRLAALLDVPLGDRPQASRCRRQVADPPWVHIHQPRARGIDRR
jgi:hypothetical protein